jgi:hypothetical protein
MGFFKNGHFDKFLLKAYKEVLSETGHFQKVYLCPNQ